MSSSTHVCAGRHVIPYSSPSPTPQQFKPGDIYPTDFDLTLSAYDGPANFTLIPCAMPESRCSDCGLQQRHMGCVIVGIHGSVCGGSGTSEARSAYGIYYAKNSRFNMGNKRDEHISDQKAQLWALFSALHMGMVILCMDAQAKEEVGELRQVVIKTDSEWLVKAMTELMPAWKAKGWKNGKGKALADADTLKLVDASLEGLVKQGVEVLFWGASKEENMGAVEMAKMGLDNGGKDAMVAPNWSGK